MNKKNQHNGISASLWLVLNIAPMLLFALPVGCSCFPDQSKEIGKERDWDKKNVELQQERDQRAQAIRSGLRDIQQRCPDLLDQTKLFQGNGVKELLEKKYIPYFQTQKELQEHLAKHERDRAKQSAYKKKARDASWYLQEIPKWINEHNTKEMYELILPSFEGVQEAALREELAKLHKKFPGLDKTELFQGDDVKDLLKNRYIPYLHACKAHNTYVATHGKDAEKAPSNQKATEADKSLQNVSGWLQHNDQDKLYELIQELMKNKAK